ncbi:succinate dehydrogenase/fumarate reductase iron-sulfur subunit [Polyangium sp. y55x31]|uniref:succinate dehydrogenase/fumarate reductase iron-sulfur subunit n=1 Tax=Polyangium sp. y55x31 TaxID=3042688 RepID=UPI0024829A16|nr:succinate dehydrogenase/fumarate reductase iron-sulfur subunit [Polyangium sp. y55x31]MDI1482271.1 succinate dehydrogenase/fumarate reductase iron-sulfur subunit [Polyangium sp. y55x31]
MRIALEVWRQRSPEEPGRFVRYETTEASPDMSLLELLDVINEGLVSEGEEPIAFDSDCREGICGTCGFMVNGLAHGPLQGAATCQVYLRSFRDGETLFLEPFRAHAFPLIKDLVINRSALDRIITAGGYVSVNTGNAPEANTSTIPKDLAEQAMDAAACIACGACIAACPNASAALFTGAKITHLGKLPEGQPERGRRALRMVRAAAAEGFGHCTFAGECETACPKSIPLQVITQMNHDYLAARLRGEGRATARHIEPGTPKKRR